MFARLSSQWYLLDNLDTVNLKPTYFLRIVGQYTYFPQTQIPTDLSSNPLIPLVCHKSQLEICLYRVKTLLLKFIGMEFVCQADTPAFLSQIDQGAFTGLFNHFHRCD